MDEPLTDELLEELLNSPSADAFASAHRLEERSLADYLQQLLDEKGLKRPQVISDAGIDSTYGYEMFTGAKHPKRNYLLKLAFALRASLQETNRMLQAGGHNELYCKNRRDAIIIFCLDRGYTLMQTDAELYRFGEDTIS